MSFLAFHMQDPFPRWNDMLHQAYSAHSPFRMIKCFHPEDYSVAQAASPGIKFIFRHWADDPNRAAWIERAKHGSAEANAAADEFISMFRDSVNQHMGTQNNGLKFAESLNEEYPTNDPDKLYGTIEFDRAFIRRLPVHCPGARPVVFCAAVGNPGHNEYAPLVPLARELQAAGGAFGYHNYFGVCDKRDWINSSQHARDLHMRWQVIDEYLYTRGIYVNWALGESGPTKCNPDGYGLSPIPGWKASEVYNGNVDRFMDAVTRLDNLMANTVAARQGRLFGAALFTVPGRGQWDTFDLPAQQIADYVTMHPSPGGDPPPIPDPDPDPEPGPGDVDLKAVWALSVQMQIEHGIMLNPKAGLQAAILAKGLTPTQNEFTHEGRTYQAGEDPKGIKSREVFAWRAGEQIWSFQDPN